MTAGIQEIEVRYTSSPNDSLSVGILASDRRRVFFEYSNDWLQRNLELSPFSLPLRPGLLEHKQREFGPLFGVFDDSLPDGWGLSPIPYFPRQNSAKITSSISSVVVSPTMLLKLSRQS